MNHFSWKQKMTRVLENNKSLTSTDGSGPEVKNGRRSAKDGALERLR